MKKGKVTREMIVEKAAELFNSMGYFRASMSDLMEATGLEKGGIYNHFSSKDELAVAAFDHAVKVFGKRIQNTVEEREAPMERLFAFIEGFKSNVFDPPIAGGCPLLNCAIENDDGNPLLNERSRGAAEKLMSYLERLIIAGQDAGEIARLHQARHVATFIVSSLEGGIMLSRLYKDNARMEFVADSLKNYLLGLKGN